MAEQPAAAGGGDYSVGLFSCFEEPVQSLLQCFVPCVGFGDLYAARQGETEPMGSTSCLIGGAITCVPVLNCIFIGLQRSEFQKEVGIPDQGIMNIVLSAFCGCCTVVQDRRQYMKSKGEPKLFLFD
mmetsp:Transcript_32468/g.79466  ORF Transcript_32468/g.79466 Transcript_32468/m.79466 type:complete len:127 (-) Transcript_32468:179-559(-)|eukprot:CAMPEP_0198322380 /NCGR_PEP_ID=MMETSP1450-20131203/10867_1 /TAXON_ID=753684 ORGANISM="Madagascaria erythrocladiodes, Strain CCMP3234" /NCGR_SAMPLE_ID=MMETSP1450 /ASSEMBLY_ACC=CAM_ASM_001115 /LENGTH=126 /DNA_ID=CAMNT_0044025993 /DNA_START=329 /DNA_END=709 /DNA_ORIENTATION=+